MRRERLRGKLCSIEDALLICVSRWLVLGLGAAPCVTRSGFVLFSKPAIFGSEDLAGLGKWSPR